MQLSYCRVAMVSKGGTVQTNYFKMPDGDE